MFGYLQVSKDLLSEEEYKRYKSCYCGLCRVLKDKYGALFSLSVNYDITFLTLLLNSLYEPQECNMRKKCIKHALHPCETSCSDFAYYSVDMGTALLYYKAIDNWNDEKSLAGLLLSKVLEHRVIGYLKKQYGEKLNTIAYELNQLERLEKNKIYNSDEASSHFGNIMAEIFTYYDNDIWNDYLKRFGYYLGKFIYLIDAAIDLDGDIRHNRYNPLTRYASMPESERNTFFKLMLKDALGDAVINFDMLPLIKDAGILKNVLCSGVWEHFAKQYSTGKEQ